MVYSGIVICAMCEDVKGGGVEAVLCTVGAVHRTVVLVEVVVVTSCSL